MPHRVRRRGYERDRVVSTPSRLSFAVAIATSLASAIARADDAPPPAPPGELAGEGVAAPAVEAAEVPDVQEVRVAGAKARRPPAASEFSIDVERMRDVPRANAEQLLTLAPGLFLATHAGEGHASSIFLRGFDAGEGQDLEIQIDGVPVNEPSNAHAHGYADTHFLMPELVQRLRVVEGPFDPSQGDFAVAGSVYYELGTSRRGTMVKGTVGSFGHKRVALVWAPKGESDGTFVAADAVDGDGFGPNRAYSSARALARWEKELGQGFKLQALGTSYTGRFDSAGVVRNDDVRANAMPCAATPDAQFFCTYDPNQGGASARHGLSVQLSRRRGREAYTLQAFAHARALRTRQNYTGYLLDIVPSGDAQRGDGSEHAHATTTFGSRGSYATSVLFHGRRQEFEAGYFARYDKGDASMRRLRTADGVPYATTFDNGLDITDIGVYAKASLVPLPWLAIRGGARIDSFGFFVEDRNRPALDRSGARLPSDRIESYGLAFQPRGAVDVRLASGLRWLTAIGIGTRSSDAKALSQGEFAPFSRVRAMETGLVHETKSPVLETNTRLVGFHTRVDNDLLFDESLGRNSYVGASNRFGALVASRMGLPWGIDVLSNLTYAEAYAPPAGAGFLTFAEGTRYPYTPRWVARVDAVLSRSAVLAGERVGYGVSLGTSYVAPRPLPVNQLSPAYATTDLGLRAGARGVELGLAVQNAFDRRNWLAVYNYASNFRGPDAFASLFPAQHFSAGPPRTIWFTVTLQLDQLGRREPS